MRGILALVVLAFPLIAHGAAALTAEVHKHPQCGCCSVWSRHLEVAGFEVTTVPALDSDARWQAFGVPRTLGACHTAKIDGYIVEGHVPAADILRLLDERPEALGLVVPGMPMGSPGMEGPRSQAYDVLLLKADGTTEVFARYPAGR
jgi:hypothetical protein